MIFKIEQETIEKLDVIVERISEDIGICCELLDIGNKWVSNPEKPHIFNPVLSKAAIQLKNIFQKSIKLRIRYDILRQLEPSGYEEYPWKMVNDQGYVDLYGPDLSKLYAKVEHRFLAEKKFGRPLEKNELVHHKDGNKTNNNIDNLQVVSKSEHGRIHAELRKAG